MKILITSGATREYIDRVRFISNISTGETSLAIAEEMKAHGHEVYYLHGEGAKLSDHCGRKIGFKDFKDLDFRMKILLSEENFDCVIHAAAVSDYSVESISQSGKTLTAEELQKINSASELKIILKPNHKILSLIKGYTKSHKPFVVGFKLTCTQDKNERERIIKNMLKSDSIDMLVHNDLYEFSEKTQHPFSIHDQLGTVLNCESKRDLSFSLTKRLEEVL